MKFDKNYDFRNIFNNIRSSSFHHGYLIGISSQQVRIDTTKRNTKHYSRSVEGEKIKGLFNLFNIPKMLLGKTKKEYFGR